MNIVVNLQVELTHQWSDCPLEEVNYLKNEHRHLFFICCKKEVNHNNRDIEIIQFKHKIEEFIKELYPKKKMGEISCEMLAEILKKRFNLVYCSVLEDNENGAEI